MTRIPLYALTAAFSLIAAVACVTDPQPVAAPAETHTRPLRLRVEPSTPPRAMLAGYVGPSMRPELEEELILEAAGDYGVAPSTDEAPSTGTVSPAKTPPPSSTTTSTTTTVPPAEEESPSGAFDAAAESEFASLIDSLRESNGKPSLIRDGSLDSYARDWAKHMAQEGSLSHSDLSSLMPPWSAVAENIGQGGSVSQVFDLMKASSGHLSNMLGDYTHVGIGVWREADGTIWTAHVFATS